MLKKTSLAGAIALASFLAACGGGGGGDSASSGGGNTTPTSATIAGPLDTVQNAVTNSVITPLVSATGSTPLAGVLLCANSLITRNTLDVADAFANGLANPTTLVSTTPAQAQAALGALVSNLSGLLTSLASTSNGTPCSGLAASSVTVPTTNPLAGTPLEPLGAALLPALLSAQQQLQGSTTPLSATQLSSILSTISAAFNTGVAALPSSVTGAPILGGAILTAQDALNQLTTIAGAAAGGASPTVIAADLQTLAQSVISDLLTKVLPVGSLQNSAGAGATTDVLATLLGAVSSLTSGLSTNPTTALPSNPLGGTGFASLTTLISQVQSVLTSGLTGSSSAPTSSPLTLATGLIQTLLGSLLTPISGGGSGGSGGSGSCLLAILGLC